MTGQPTEADDLAAYGLAARLLLAYDAADLDQIAQLLDDDTEAAVVALITLAGALADQAYGEQVRQALHNIATAADLDAIGRQVAHQTGETA